MREWFPRAIRGEKTGVKEEFAKFNLDGGSAIGKKNNVLTKKT